MVKTDIEEAFRIVPLCPEDYASSVSNGMVSSILLNASPWSVRLCANSLRDSVQPFSGWHNINKGATYDTHGYNFFISTQRSSQPVSNQNFLDMYSGINVPTAPEKTKKQKKKKKNKLLAPLQFLTEIRLSQDKLDTCTEVISSLLEGSKIYIAQITVGYWPS